MIEVLLLMFISTLFLIVSMYVKVNDKVLAVIYIIVVSIFAANRDVAYPDTYGYILLFQRLSFDFSSMIDSTYMEPGFIVLSILIKFIFGNSYKIYFFIISVLNMSLILLGMHFFNCSTCSDKDSIALSQKREIKYTIPLVLYLMTYGYGFNLNIIRAGIAFSLIFLAVSLFKENKIKSLLIYLLSLTFHNSAVLMIVTLPFLLSKKKHKKGFFYSWLIIIFPLLILGYFNIFVNLFFIIVNKVPYLSLQYRGYISDGLIVERNTALIRVSILIILGVLAIESHENEQRNYILKSYLLGLTICALFFSVALIDRITIYFIAMIFILLSYHLSFRKGKILYKIALIFGLAYFVISTLRLVTYYQ